MKEKTNLLDSSRENSYHGCGIISILIPCVYIDISTDIFATVVFVFPTEI